MKTKCLLSIVLTALISFNAFAGDNLLTNGDFEIFTTKGEVKEEGWTDATTNNELEQNADNVINGEKSIRFTGVNTGSWFTRVLDVEAGATYTFSFTGRIQDAVGPSGSETSKIGTLTGRIKGHPEGEWIVLMSTQSNIDTSMSAEYTVPDSVTQIKVQVYKDKKIAYIDDLSLVKKESSSLHQQMASGIKVFSGKNGAIRIKSNDAITSYAVYSITGTLMQQATVNNTTTCTKPLSQGIYLVKLQSESGQAFTQKVIVK